MLTLWNMLFYKPIYNTLFFVVDILPNHSLFIAVIILTIIVRLIISPLSYKSVKTQIKTKKLQPQLNEIKNTITDKQEQAQKTLELYRKEGINPFSSFLLLLVQLPIIIALYRVFQNGLIVDIDLLYSFVSAPEIINTQFLGINLAEKSLLLAVLAGITQYLHISQSTGMQQMKSTEGATEQEKMMAGVGKLMKFMLPAMITVFAYNFGGALALYFVTSNIFMFAQEKIVQNMLNVNNRK